MTVLPRGGGGLRRQDVVVGLIAGLVVLGVTFHDPTQGGLLLAAGAVALVVAVLALRDPAVAALLLLLCSYGREAIHADVLTYGTYLLLLSSAVSLWTHARELPRFGAQELLIALFLLWTVTSMILPHPTPTDDVWHFVVKGTVIPIALYLVGRVAFDRARMVRAVMWLVVAFTAYSTVNAYAQLHGPKALVFPKVTITESGWVGRAVGVFNQPVVNGLLLTVGFVVMIYLASDRDLRQWVRVALLFGALGAAYGVLLTHTRSALLALVAVVVLGALFATGWRTPFVITLVVGAVAGLADIKELTSTDRDAGGLGSSEEVIDRLNIDATLFRAIRENPGAGLGLNRFATYNTYDHMSWSWDLPWVNGYGNPAHETELGIAAELGIPGLLFWAAMLLAIVWALVMAYRKLPVHDMHGRKLAFVGLAAIVAWELNAVTVDMRLLDFANALPFLLMGLAVGMHDRWKTQGRLTLDDPAVVVPDLPGPRRGPAISGPIPTRPRRPEPAA